MFGAYNPYCGGQAAGSFGAQGFGQQAGFFGSQAYGQTAGYGAAPAYAQTAGYGAAPAYAQTAGYGAAPAYAQTAGYGAAPAYAQTAGYGAAPAYAQTAGYGAAPAYAQTASYGAAPAFGQSFGQTGGYFDTQSAVYGTVSAAAPASAFQSAGDLSFAQGRGSANNFEQKQPSVASSSSSPLGADLQTNALAGAAPIASLEGSGGSIGSASAATRRQGRLRKQVVRLPDPPQGPPRQVRQRLPTPEPDTVERVYLQRAAPEIVEEIVEIPTTPPPRIQEKHVVEPAGPAQRVKRVVRVPPRSGGGNTVAPQQQNLGAFGSSNQFSSNAISAGSFGGVQQGFGTAVGTGNFGGFTGFGSTAGGFQQGFGGFQSMAAAAPRFNSIPPSLCFST